MAKQYGNFTDFISVARASSGTCLRKVKFGPNLVADLSTLSEVGDAASTAVYNPSTGAVDINSATTLDGFILLNPNIELGKLYRVNVDITFGTTTSARVSIGPSYTTQDDISVSGVVSLNFVAESQYIRVDTYAGTGTMTVNSVSIQECHLDHKDGELILFNHPENVARVEYDEYGRVIGTLIEEARTNLVTDSEDFTVGSWATNSTATGAADVPLVTQNYAKAPDGTYTASRVQFETNSATSSDRSICRIVETTAVQRHGSFWLRSNTGAAQIIGVHAGNIEEYWTVTGEWQRFDTDVIDAAEITFGLEARGNTQTGTTVDLLVWGAQLEAGAFPTSYIPTSGSTATRAVDIESIGADQFGTNQAAGTIVVTYNPLAYKTNQTAFNLGRLSPTDGISWYSSSGHHRVSAVGLNSTTSFPIGLNGEPVGGTEYTSAVYYAQSDVGISVDGAATVSASSYDPPPLEALVIGDDQNGNDSFNGHIKSIKYYPRRLTNDQLEALSS